MKIIYGITKSNWGGAQRYVFDLALAAKNEGHDVAVLCGGEGSLVEKLTEAGIRIISIPYLSRDLAFFDEIKSFIDIFRALRRERPDVFHINSSKMGGLGTFAGRLVGIRKIIFTAHGWAFNENRHWAQKILIEELAWLTILFSHHTICVSERVKFDVDAKPFVKKKLSVVHNGIEDFALFSSTEARRELLPDISSDHLIVGTLSELHHTKGLDVALRAINKLSANIHFAITGAGDREKDLRLLAKTLGITERIHFLGFVDNARSYLKAFDVFTLTSRTEGLPYVLLEAGIASLPVVATRVGGIPEVIKDEDTGLLVESERPQDLTNALKKLLDDRNLRESLGKNLHEFVTESFSKEKMVKETFSLYH